MNEKLSELIDQELSHDDRDRVFTEILSDEKQAQSWQRYHLIGSVIRNEVHDTSSDLSEKIWEKIESEPTVLAPVKRKKTSTFNNVLPGAGLFALAASIALVAVITLNPTQQSQVEQLASSNSLNTSLVANDAVVSLSQEQQRINGEFGEMLAEHGEFSSSAGLNGLVAYAKLVSNQSMDQ